MNQKSFTKPPLSSQTKEKKAEEFMSMTLPMAQNAAEETTREIHETARITSKDPMIPYALRLPKRLHDNVREIANITGLSFNSVCIEMLRTSAKSKLQELKE